MLERHYLAHRRSSGSYEAKEGWYSDKNQPGVRLITHMDTSHQRGMSRWAAPSVGSLS